MGPWSPNTLPGSSLGCHGEAPPFRVSVSSYRESKAQGPRRTLPRPLATFLTSTVSKVLFLGVLRQIHLTQLFRGHGAAPGPHEGDLSPSSDGRPRVGRVELHHPLAQVPFAVPGQQSLMGSMLFLLIFWNPQYHHFGWVGSDPVGGGVCQRGTKETHPHTFPQWVGLTLGQGSVGWVQESPFPTQVLPSLSAASRDKPSVHAEFRAVVPPVDSALISSPVPH